jgi:hypothetical protein
MTPLLKVSKIVEFATIYPAAVMEDLAHQSLPVPVFTPKGFCMAFIYCHAELASDGQGMQLWPPDHQALMNAETGRFEELRTVASTTYDQSHAMTKPMGACPGEPQREQDEYLNKLVALYQAYDAILPSFAASPYAMPAAARPAAREFERLFADVAEKPLLPYYRAVGHEFFRWLGSEGR